MTILSIFNLEKQFNDTGSFCAKNACFFSSSSRYVYFTSINYRVSTNVINMAILDLKWQPKFLLLSYTPLYMKLSSILFCVRIRTTLYTLNHACNGNATQLKANVKRLFAHPHPPVVFFLLVVPRWFLCCSSSLFVYRRFYMWRLFYHCLFGSPSVVASGGLCLWFRHFLGVFIYIFIFGEKTVSMILWMIDTCTGINFRFAETLKTATQIKPIKTVKPDTIK